MKTSSKSISLFAACLCPLFIACLWDYDTIQMERQEFPTALELITGKFLRHSDVYYQWRIEDRTPKLSASPSAELFDDLAVAHEKLGNHDQAIGLMREKQLGFPDLYETHANLGTFYIHKGEHKKGVEEIAKAIAINPDAHFGREIYQKALVEYLLSVKEAKRKEEAELLQTMSPPPSPDLKIADDGKISLPLNTTGIPGPYSKYGFAKYLEVSADEEDGKKAVKGILGMMRFGNYDSPVLLEALGDLLQTSDDSNMIAARAYLKASYAVNDRAGKLAYREKATGCIERQEYGNLHLLQLEKEFQSEIYEAEQWFTSLAEDESTWASQGLNLDQEFDRKYYDDPMLSIPSVPFTKTLYSLLFQIAVIAVPTVLFLKWWNRRRRHAQQPAQQSVEN